jgi:hypothetical protein
MPLTLILSTFYPGVFDEKISEAIFSTSKHRGENLLKQIRWGKSN